MVTCPLAPRRSHLTSGFCTSPRNFGLDFLQTLPHDNALALFLACGSANTWQEELHLPSLVPCPAHMSELCGRNIRETPRRSLHLCTSKERRKSLLLHDAFNSEFLVS